MKQHLAEDENVKKKNGPKMIVDEYMELMSNQWLAAKDKLDELYPDDSKEEAKLKMLCLVLTVCTTSACTVLIACSRLQPINKNISLL